MAKSDNAWFNEATSEVFAPKGRMVYPTLLEPKGIKDKPDSKPKFSVTLLIPKAANIDVIKKYLTAAALEKFGKDWTKKKLLLPLLKTEDQEKLQDLAEAFPYILRCSATPAYPPYIYAPNAKQYEGDGTDIYSGRWAVACGKFYAYDNVSKGVNFGLNKIQLLDHDEPVAGGRVATADGFDAIDVGNGAIAGNTDEVFGGANDEIPF